VAEYKRNTMVEAFCVDEEWLILHPERCTITKLNEVGRFCWERLDREYSLTVLAEEVQREYDISAEQALEDIERFLEELSQIGLVERAG
jgi:hypothetical protein